MTTETLGSYSPEAIGQIKRLHGQLANYLSKYGEPDFTQFKVFEGESDKFFEIQRKFADKRDATYNTPIIGGLRRAMESISAPLDREGLFFSIGMNLEALEYVAKKSAVKKLVARYKKPGVGLVLRSIKPDLPSDYDDIFRTRWWETETLEDYPLLVSSVAMKLSKGATLPAETLNRGKLQLAFLIMPPGSHITESCAYVIPDQHQQNTPFLRIPLIQDTLIRLSRLPRSLGQRQKD